MERNFCFLLPSLKSRLFFTLYRSDQFLNLFVFREGQQKFYRTKSKNFLEYFEHASEWQICRRIYSAVRLRDEKKKKR